MFLYPLEIVAPEGQSDGPWRLCANVWVHQKCRDGVRARKSNLQMQWTFTSLHYGPNKMTVMLTFVF